MQMKNIANIDSISEKKAGQAAAWGEDERAPEGNVAKEGDAVHRDAQRQKYHLQGISIQERNG